MLLSSNLFGEINFFSTLFGAAIAYGSSYLQFRRNYRFDFKNKCSYLNRLIRETIKASERQLQLFDDFIHEIDSQEYPYHLPIISEVGFSVYRFLADKTQSDQYYSAFMHVYGHALDAERKYFQLANLSDTLCRLSQSIFLIAQEGYKMCTEKQDKYHTEYTALYNDIHTLRYKTNPATETPDFIKACHEIIDGFSSSLHVADTTDNTADNVTFVEHIHCNITIQIEEICTRYTLHKERPDVASVMKQLRALHFCNKDLGNQVMDIKRQIEDAKESYKLVLDELKKIKEYLEEPQIELYFFNNTKRD
ncbi:hypothetical protein ACTHGU_21055 [Chitinophagaceae bacterium MMS25-I14]